MIAVGVIGSLVFVGWLIWRAARKIPIKAYTIMYGLSCVSGLFSFAFFLNMDIPKMVKILVCIILGALMIFMAAWLQRQSKQGEV